MWLDLDGLRVVHACWDQKSIDLLAELAGRECYLNPGLLVRASTKGAPEYEAIETLLKGHEIGLPEGISFRDKDDQPLVSRLSMTIDNETIGFLIVCGLVIAAAVFLVKLFRERNLCPNCGDPSGAELLKRLPIEDPRARDLEGTELKLTQIVKCKRCGHEWQRTHPIAAPNS